MPSNSTAGVCGDVAASWVGVLLGERHGIGQSRAVALTSSASAVTWPAVVVSGTLIVPFSTPVCAFAICAHTLVEMYLLWSSEMPPLASVRL